MFLHNTTSIGYKGFGLNSSTLYVSQRAIGTAFGAIAVSALASPEVRGFLVNSGKRVVGVVKDRFFDISQAEINPQAPLNPDLEKVEVSTTPTQS